MKKLTKLSIQWFYNLLERGECDIMDFKEQLEDKMTFGKSLKNFAPKYDETARDVVAFANNKGVFYLLALLMTARRLTKISYMMRRRYSTLSTKYKTEQSLQLHLFHTK